MVGDRNILHCAADSGKPEVVRLFAVHKDLLEAKDKDGHTPLTLAAKKGHVEACDILLKAGASPKTLGAHDRNALHWAAFWDNLNLGVQRFGTFFLITLGWVFFRAKSFGDCLIWFKNLFGFGETTLGHVNFDLGLLISLNLFGLILVNGFGNASSKNWEEVSHSRQFALGVAALCALVFMNFSSKFLYYQFYWPKYLFDQSPAS